VYQNLYNDIYKNQLLLTILLLTIDEEINRWNKLSLEFNKMQRGIKNFTTIFLHHKIVDYYGNRCVYVCIYNFLTCW